MTKFLSFAAVTWLLAFSSSALSQGSALTALAAKDLDPAAFSEWVDGAEKAIAPTGPKDDVHVPQWIVWTHEKGPGHSGLLFGDSKTPGVRHLRVGWAKAIPVGSIVARASAKLSVLKPGAPYPGNVTDETQWIPGQRLQAGALTGDEAERDQYAVWVFPPGTQSRALRFTHRS